MTSQREMIASRTVFISCIVPVYNEESNIATFFPALDTKLKSLTQHYEIIAINDGSRDNSQAQLEILHQQLGIKVLQFSRNFGKEIAITAGLDFATGDVTIIMDGDFQHPFDTFDVFLQKWAEGYEMVYAIRNDRDDEKFLKRLFSQAFYKLMNYISNADIPADAGDFRLLDRKVVQALQQTQERVRFMKGLYSWAGFNSIGVPFTVQERAAGKSSWRFMNLLNLAITGIVSFSEVPLRAWGIMGFIISLAAFISIIVTIIKTWLFGVDVPGYATLLIVITFFGGVQLLSIGILGEYIARIFNEVKQRPKYLLTQTLGFKSEQIDRIN